MGEMRRLSDVGESVQRVRTIIGLPDWDLDPEAPGDLWLSNVVYRVVNVDLDAITGCAVVQGTTTDSWSNLYDLGGPTKRVDLWAKDNDTEVQLADAWGDWMPMIVVPAGAYITLDVVATGLRAKTHTTGDTSYIQAIGWH